MRRLFSIAIAALLAGQAWAQTTFTVNKLKYTVIDEENHYVSVNKSDYFPPNNLVIPETVVKEGVTYTIKSIVENAFKDYSFIESVSLPNTIESIGQGAFSGLAIVKSIDIPTSVSSIGTNAFKGVTHLFYSGTALGSPWGAKHINGVLDENGVIYSDDSKNVIISYIGNNGSVTISGNVKLIDRDAFANCRKLKEVVISTTYNDESQYPQTPKIGDYAFSDCQNLERINLGDNILTIGNYAFSGCKKLTSIDIPQSAIYILSGVFMGCSSLTAINVAATNERYSSVDGVLFNKDKTQLICYPQNKEGKTYTIPNSVTKLENKSFYCTNNLDTVIITGGVQTIEGATFQDARSIKSVVLFNSITKISSMTFYGCNSLESIAIPSSVKTIEDRAFYNCTKLKPIYIPTTVTSIGSDAFMNVPLIIYNGTATGSRWGAKAIIKGEADYDGFVYADEEYKQLVGYIGDETMIAIPATVTTIGDKTFSYCSGLKSVTIPNTVTSISSTAFQGCNQLDTLQIYTNSIGTEFSNITSLKSIYIGATVTSIATDAFSNCTNLEEVKFYANAIGTEFSQKSSLKNVIIGSTVRSIEGEAFAGCTNLKTVVIPNSVTTIGDDAFLNVKNIVNNSQATGSPWGALNVGGVEDEGGFIFSDSQKTNLVGYVGEGGEITIPNTVISITEKAFVNRGNLSSVTISSAVASIALDAFSGCGSLTAIDVVSDNENFSAANGILFNKDKTTIIRCLEAKSATYTIPSTVTRIADSAFYNCKKITSITLTDDLVGIGCGAFAGCIQLKFNNQSNASYLGKTGNNYFALIAANSTDITECTINSNCKVIAEDAFQNCSSLSEITIPTSVTSINKNAFKGCSNLTIRCKAVSQPAGWDGQWNPDNRPVEWTKQWTVTVLANNSAYGSVTGGGIVIDGSTTTITATPATGCKFVKWSNGLTNTNKTITVTSDTTLTAVFEIIKYNVTLSANNAAYGIVEGSGTFAYGSTTTVTAIPAIGYKFVKWNNGSTKATETITVTSNLTMIAEFAAVVWNVSLSTNNSSYGTVSGGGSITHGSTTTITATPKTGYKFVKWSNDLTSPNNTITVTSDTTLTAVFEIINYNVTVAANNSAYGTVEGGGSIAHGSATTIIATPAEGYKFVRWSNGSTNATQTITVTSDLTLTAEFAAVVWNVSLSANNISYGTVSGGGSIADGSTTTITATPAEGCDFVKWSNGLTNATETITVTSDTTLVAEFIKSEVAYPGGHEISFSVRHYTGCYVAEMSTLTYGKNVDIPTDMTIDGEIYTISSISSKCFQNNTDIISIYIPPTVTVIRDSAFAGCKNLEITCAFDSKPRSWSDSWNPDNLPVEWLGMVSCEELDAPTDSVTFGYRYYQNNHTVSLTKYSGYSSTVAVPEKMIVNGDECTVTSIESSCFQNNRFIAYLSIPATVTSIGDSAFAGCSGMKIDCAYSSKPGGWSDSWNPDNLSVEWGSLPVEEDPGMNTPTDVANFTFRITSSSNHTVEIAGYIGSESDITIPEKVTIEGVEYSITGVGRDAFWGTSITSVGIPASITNIDRSFNDCLNLTEINVASDNTSYASENGVLFNKDKTTLLCCPAGKNGDYIIPSTVTVIAERGFRKCAGLTSVEIPDGVTSIGEFAFGRCSGLTSIKLPESLKTIETTMLAGCSNLASVTFGSQIETIGEFAFQSCDSLTTITIPRTVKSVLRGAFFQCSGLESIYIPNSVTTVEQWTFRDCSELTIYCEASSKPSGWHSAWNDSYCPVVWGYSGNNEETPASDFTFKIIDDNSAEVTGYTGTDTAITIPQKVVINGDEYTVTSIGNQAFEGNNKLTTVIIPNTVTTIGDNAFSGCTELDSIVIPNSVENISSTAFVASEGTCGPSARWSYDILTKTLTISGEGWLDDYGYDFATQTDKAPWAAYKDQMESVVVEEGITALGSSLFGSSSVKYASLPSTCKSYSSAFNMCWSLEKVVVRARSVMSVNSYSFDNYDNCTLYVPMDLVDFYSDRIAFGDFSKIVGFYSITVDPEIKNGTVAVDKELILENEPFTITTTSDEGYVVGTVLVNGSPVENTNSIHAVGDDKSIILVSATFNKAGNGGNNEGNNEGVKPEDFTYGIISFSKMQVEIDGYNGTCTDIEIPKTVSFGSDEYAIVAIGDEAFRDCSNLKSVTIPSTITSIGDDAFQNCISLESVSLPNTIKVIGACTFAECTSLKSIEIPNSVTFIGNSAFAESGLESIVIPNSVTEISSYAFQDCADLVSVEIPNSVESIGMSAFQNCSSLGSVKIPSSVTNIGIAAFKGCSNASFECDFESKPDGWDEWWNYDNRPVVWKNNAGTAVAESAASAVNIFAFSNTIIVENADAEIFVYDAMGRLVVEMPHCDVSTEIHINGTGVYLVKVGNTAKRVMIND